MAPFVQEVRSYRYRGLGYLDEFLFAPPPHGEESTPDHCRRATVRMQALLDHLGLKRHPVNGEWSDARVFEHLGGPVDTE